MRMSICFATFSECDRAHVCRLQRVLGWRRWKYVRREEKKICKNSCTDTKGYVSRVGGPPTRQARSRPLANELAPQKEATNRQAPGFRYALGPGLERWHWCGYGTWQQAPATRPTLRSNRPNALRFETHASQLISCLRRPHKMRLQQLRAKPPAQKRRRTRRTSPRRRSTPAPPTAPTMAQARLSPVLVTATENCQATRSLTPRW